MIRPKIIKPKVLNPGDKSVIEPEEPLEDIGFNVFKFNNRPVPENPKEKLIISCFSEFGCEIVGSMYLVPEICREYPGKYKIVMGWHGRDYLYKHLVDEFWELKEEHQWLREYCRAFHHDSKNLSRIESRTKEHGRVIPVERLGRMAVCVKCAVCQKLWAETRFVERCRFCGGPIKRQSLFGDVQNYKKSATRIPQPSPEKLLAARQYLKTNKVVGVFARGRKCYGRNLPPDFYEKLIKLLEGKGYEIVWLGEKATTQPCPSPHIVDFSRMAEARDLETTLAIISQCKFTIQFWTASTRLASLANTPYLLFESPDQIWGNGQEGYRRNLCDFSNNKLVLAHYHNVRDDHDGTLKLVEQAVSEIENNNYEDVFGMLDDPMAAQHMRRDQMGRIGG